MNNSGSRKETLRDSTQSGLVSSQPEDRHPSKGNSQVYSNPLGQLWLTGTAPQTHAAQLHRPSGAVMFPARAGSPSPHTSSDLTVAWHGTQRQACCVAADVKATLFSISVLLSEPRKQVTPGQICADSVLELRAGKWLHAQILWGYAIAKWVRCLKGLCQWLTSSPRINTWKLFHLLYNRTMAIVFTCMKAELAKHPTRGCHPTHC